VLRSVYFHPSTRQGQKRGPFGKELALDCTIYVVLLGGLTPDLHSIEVG